MERNVEAKTITNDVKRKMIAKALEAQRFSKRTTERFSRGKRWEEARLIHKRRDSRIVGQDMDQDQ